MHSIDPTVSAIYLYKTLILLAGLICVCLGVWLFTRRLEGAPDNVAASSAKFFGVELTRPTAGALLVIVGAVIIVYGVTRPFSITTETGPSGQSGRNMPPDSTSRMVRPEPVAQPADVDSAVRTPDAPQAPSHAATPLAPVTTTTTTITDTAAAPQETKPGVRHKMEMHRRVVICDTCPTP